MRAYKGAAALCLAVLTVAKLSRAVSTHTVTDSVSIAQPTAMVSQSYDELGPFPVITLKDTLPVVVGNGTDSRKYLLKLLVTYPLPAQPAQLGLSQENDDADAISFAVMQGSAGRAAATTPISDERGVESRSNVAKGEEDQKLPILHFFNGFQMQAPWYADTVRHLASWRYAVVQYTVSGLLPIVTDRVELSFVDAVLARLAHAAQDPLSALHAAAVRMDLNRRAVMGHSRGGKLAALHFAAGQSQSAPHSHGSLPLRTAVLLDPVDASKATPEGADWPSGAKALAGVDVPVAMIGAGVSGSCNPTDQNHQKFFTASTPSSSRMLIHQAGHMQFVHTGSPALDWAFDRLCGTGTIADKGVLKLTSAYALSWLEPIMKGATPQVTARVHATNRWLQTQAAAGVLSIDTKLAHSTARSNAQSTLSAAASTSATANVVQLHAAVESGRVQVGQPSLAGAKAGQAGAVDTKPSGLVEGDNGGSVAACVSEAVASVPA